MAVVNLPIPKECGECWNPCCKKYIEWLIADMKSRPPKPEVCGDGCLFESGNDEMTVIRRDIPDCGACPLNTECRRYMSWVGNVCDRTVPRPSYDSECLLLKGRDENGRKEKI